MYRSSVRILPALAALASISACASLSQKEKGAIIGASTGAAVGAAVGNANGSTAKGAIIGAAVGGAAGAAVGNANGSTAKGAIIGAVVGGAAGAVIGHQMDQQAKELDQSIPGAKIERVGEGIQVTFDSGLLFDFDSDRVRPDAAANLQELARSLTKFPDSDLLIVGHTDSKGDDAYNQSLSQRRSTSASAYLQSQGVPASRIRTSGRGESEPVASNDTEAGMQQNRRVEIAIYASEAYRNKVKSGI